ncbi:MAG TPA: TonB-dependent receptor, partial [Flavihumibacter sp.]
QQEAEPPVTVKGTVMDADGNPLPGVSITVKGKGTVAKTDELGFFSIEVNTGETLVFSVVGMAEQEVVVSSSKPLKITLQQKTNQLNDVVVVGYSKQKKISVTGSVSTVNMEDMQTPVISLTNALAGKVAGVISMGNRGGEPGYDNPTFTIRGIGTFTGSVSPMIIVDGVQREDVNSTYGGAFNNIDPEDIASISLLKDASATAVYGARGANGVLIITTKKGAAGKPRISAKVEGGINGLTKLPKMLDGVTYMKLYNEAQLNDPSNTSGQVTYSDEVIQKTASGLDPWLYPNVDWIKTIYKDWSYMTNANVNVSGGGEAARYYVSMSFYNQDGQYNVSKSVNGYNPNLNFKRYDFRSNVDINITKSTVLSLNIASMLVNSRFPGNSAASIWYASFATNPVAFPVKYPDNKWAGPRNNGGANPYNLVQNAGYSTEFKPSVQSVMTLAQRLDKLTKGLSAQARFSFDTYGEFGTSRKADNDLWFAGSRDGEGNLVYEHVRTGSTYLGYSTYSTGERVMYLEGNINYSRDFGDHSIGALAVANIRNRVIGTAGTAKNAIPFRNQNLAGRLTYGYMDKYLAEVNIGATGSENFAPGHRWGYFPAVSLGWVISRENFFDAWSEKVNLLKLRASTGVTGNDQIGIDNDRFGYLTYIDESSGASFGLVPRYYAGIAEKVLGTPNLTWEKSIKDNLGLELGLFNKLNIVVDVFRDRRKDILIQRNSISAIAGYSGLVIYANMGRMENKGIDGSIEYSDRIGKDLSFRLFGNVTYAKNKIIYADNPKRIYGYQQPEGHRYNEFTGYISRGLFVDQADVDKSPAQIRTVYPGDIKYADLSGDGKVDGNDWTYLGKSSFPSWSYGFGLNLGYKRIEFSALFSGVADVGIMANGSYISGSGASGVGVVPFAGIGQYPSNVLANVTSRWTREDPRQNVDYPRLTIANSSDNNYLSSTWWLKDGSFMRLKQVSLSYSFKLRNAGATGGERSINTLQVYLSGINLLTFSKFKLWDPELGSNGSQYPYSRTITLGLRAQF